MGNQQNLNGGGQGGRGGGGAPGANQGGGGSGKPSNPWLITSTGGLIGINGLLLGPAVNQITNKSYISNYDSTNLHSILIDKSQILKEIQVKVEKLVFI